MSGTGRSTQRLPNLVRQTGILWRPCSMTAYIRPAVILTRYVSLCNELGIVVIPSAV